MISTTTATREADRLLQLERIVRTAHFLQGQRMGATIEEANCHVAERMGRGWSRRTTRRDLHLLELVGAAESRDGRWYRATADHTLFQILAARLQSLGKTSRMHHPRSPAGLVERAEALLQIGFPTPAVMTIRVAAEQWLLHKARAAGCKPQGWHGMSKLVAIVERTGTGPRDGLRWLRKNAAVMHATAHGGEVDSTYAATLIEGVKRLICGAEAPKESRNLREVRVG